MNTDFRYEIKFVLNEINFSQFIQWLYIETNCRTKYPARNVNSLYFDDLDYSSVKDNLSGNANREKLRLRWYGNQSSLKITAPVLEKKIKQGRLGKKHSLTINNLQSRLYSATFSDINKEIENNTKLDDRFSCKLFFPTLYVSYQRQYFEDLNHFRITLDENIFFSNPSANMKLIEVKQVPFGNRIVELKFPPIMKDYVSDLMRPLNIVPQRHSKYLTGLAVFGQVNYI